MIMNVGVIGVGSMGKNHARIYSELKGVDNLFLFDINKKSLEQISKMTNGIPCKNIDDLLSSCDAVSICVPTEFHNPTVKIAIANNTPFLVEKPFCSDYKEGNEIIEMLPNHLVAGVGHIERFNPIVSEIKQIIKKPIYIDVKRHNPTSSRIHGTSVVDDLMIHDIDIIFNVIFNGYKYNIFSVCEDDVCTATIRFGSIPVNISASRKSSKKIRSIYIEEEDMTIEGDFMSQEIYVYKKPEIYDLRNERYIQENIVEKVVVNRVEPLRLELITFLRCIEEHREFPITLEDGLFNLYISEFIKNGGNLG